MGFIEDRKKFTRTKEQTNPTRNVNQLTKHFDMDKTKLKKQ